MLIETDPLVKISDWENDTYKSTFWHTTAHLLAYALESLYPSIKLGTGPAIDNGFYYDIDTGDRVLTADDLPQIESKMKEFQAYLFEHHSQMRKLHCH